MHVGRCHSLLFVALGALSGSTSCSRELGEDAFKREAEKAYMEAHPGWGIVRRDGPLTTFVRGDQVDVLDVARLYDLYKKSGKSATSYFEAWIEEQEADARARRRTLDQAKADVIPVLKSGSWVRVQDLGAIGPKRVQDRIRPWRKDIANDVYVLLGVPEEKLGYRFASIEEVRASPEGEDLWIARAVENLRARVGTSTASEVRGAGERLLVYDLSGYESISGLILDPKFRSEMFDKFGKDELGAAAPIRNVLIVFDPAEFSATKPVRARAHQLYDTQNHPSFRGLLRFDRSGISVLEPANPEVRKKPAE